MKRFGSKAGFTLVELIVVIAILGILAGVGTVGYGGYIKRANEAADEQLYSEIVYAGAIGSYANPGASGRVTVTKTGAQVTSSSGNDEIVKKWLSDAFGSDWENTIKYRTDTYANDNRCSTIYLPQVNVTLSEAQATLVNTFKQSSNNGHEESVAQNVDAVADFYALLVDKSGNNPLTFSQSLIGNADLAAEFAEKYGLTEESDSKTVANALVMYTASKAGALAELSDGMYDYFLFTSGYAEQAQAMLWDYEDGVIDDIDEYAKQIGEDLEYGDLSTSYRQYALDSAQEIGGLTLGLNLVNLAGYANSEYASDEFKAAYDNAMNTGINQTILTDLTNQMYGDGSLGDYGKVGSNYEGYISSGTLKTDLDGSLAALQMINDYGDQIDISVDGTFTSDTTLALLQAILAG